MTEATINFNDHCRNAALSFLQTVIVADNQPIFSSPKPPQPIKASRKLKPLPSQSLPEDPAKKAREIDSANEKRPADNESECHDINIRVIANAFSKHGLTCGSYLPDEHTSKQEIIDTTFLAARYADISIIDWQLETGDSTAAVQIIKNLLEHDVIIGGRLRLILVYTGEPDLDTAAQQLLKGIDGLAKLDGSSKRLLVSEHARIRFINKPNARKSYIDDPDIVPWEKLPEVAIDEFVSLSRGLLQAFALESIAAIRDDTHRMLAQFGSSLDGAFAGQRATASNPEDAGRLMTDIILSEFSITFSKAGVAEKILGKTGSAAWLDEQSKLQDIDATLKFTDPPQTSKKINQPIRHQLIRNGLQKCKATDEVKLKIFNSFFACNTTASKAHKEFSVLSTLARHGGPGAKRKIHVEPMLSLGVIIQPVDESLDVVWLCLQPKCDSVRLDQRSSPRGFLFVEMVKDDKCFDLVIPSLQGPKSFRLAYGEPVIRTVRFGATEGKSLALAKKQSEGLAFSDDQRCDEWLFTDAQGNDWRWVAEVREQQVLNFVNKITGQLTRVGLNQAEWLRVQSTK
ncbi:hypothetical protein ACVW0Y_002062 [Pseudomonas sp. TE3786]